MKYLVFILFVSTCNRNVVIVIDNVACNDNNGCTEAMATYVNGSLTNCFYQDTCINSDPCEGVFCNDANACTVDTCNDGHCEHSPIQIVCNDNNECTSDFPFYQCPDSVTCVYAAIPCDTAECYTNMDCDDADLCSIDSCINEQCYYWSRTYELCRDSMNYCTAVACVSEDNDSYECVVTVNNYRSCDDENACTTDSCMMHGCSNLYGDTCNDNSVCTHDLCFPISTTVNPRGYTCRNMHLDCDDGIDCTDDFCEDDCVHDDTCITCPYDTLFLDWCKFIICENGVFRNAQRNCSDNLECTNDICHKIAAFCQHMPVDCDSDGVPCTDYCDPINGCVFYQPVNCDDDNPCTVDFCNPISQFPDDPCYHNNICGSAKRDMDNTKPILLDLTGKEMTANFEDLPTGMYIKHYIDNGILRVQKIIKQ